jgi:hypothetical protein
MKLAGLQPLPPAEKVIDVKLGLVELFLHISPCLSQSSETRDHVIFARVNSNFEIDFQHSDL